MINIYNKEELNAAIAKSQRHYEGIYTHLLFIINQDPASPDYYTAERYGYNSTFGTFDYLGSTDNIPNTLKEFIIEFVPSGIVIYKDSYSDSSRKSFIVNGKSFVTTEIKELD